MAISESPAALLRALLPDAKQSACDSFIPPSDDRLNAYDMEAVAAIRKNDLTKLRELLASGKSFEACNRSGESLLHLACRRGNVQTVRFLIEEACVRTDDRDDLGRTILHDACWRPSPDFDLMDALIRTVSPDLLLSQDARGHSCFDYVRKADWSEWMQYLVQRRELILQRVALSKATTIQGSLAFQVLG